MPQRRCVRQQSGYFNRQQLTGTFAPPIVYKMSRCALAGVACIAGQPFRVSLWCSLCLGVCIFLFFEFQRRRCIRACVCPKSRIALKKRCLPLHRQAAGAGGGVWPVLWHQLPACAAAFNGGRSSFHDEIRRQDSLPRSSDAAGQAVDAASCRGIRGLTHFTMTTVVWVHAKQRSYLENQENPNNSAK